MLKSLRAGVLKASVAPTIAGVAQAGCAAADGATAALVRVWASNPGGAFLLVGSAGRPIGGGSYHQTNGGFSVVPHGAGKIGRIASTNQPMVVRGLRGDEAWLENPAWIARQGIRSFVGLPISAEGEVLGVMVLFDRALTSDETIEELRFLTDVIAVRWRYLRSNVRGPVSSDTAVAVPNPILTRPDLRALERRSIEAALAQTRGKVFGTDGAAALLAMKPTTLASRIKALGIEPGGHLR